MADRFLVVSRHKTFVEFIKKVLDLKDDEIEVVETVTPEILKNRVVITSGLPIHMMALAKEVITVDLELPRDPEERAKALEELEKDYRNYKKYLKSISKYKVEREELKVDLSKVLR